ncbi:hypothetical protein ACFU8T_12540 [Sphingobacterium spiritivorum]|uniref:MlpB protein n=1 Tax=Sphingobacterium spiritivorum ATCC 33861 TaxID=525373 RepID=D7VKD5_SPHSI|nr:hypothetical protein [Sphingobacterium spiritivorum]EFK58737.1 hypothetical protein HMPREF0766_11454 [Sphingobacterium spiritivorum ATCC 33861]QQT34376.1 hypothetical protein I6J01_13680 [Sphingobacterium spiritivorum]WQD35223.1 hypothetical protein U0038_05615 [Sphingobacterium spiritivorum]
MKILKMLSGSVMLLILLSGCQNNNTPAKETIVEESSPAEPIALAETVKKGDHVPSELVCMVNDAYMGKEQIKVDFEGKTYYGCCNMCKERIPKDAAVRTAIDPQTMKSVDKASAYIVMIGDNGEVAYFESKQTYDQFLEKQQN